MSVKDFNTKLDEAHARFAGSDSPEQRFRSGLEWVDLLLACGKYPEASEAAGILTPLASSPLDKADVFQRSARAFLRMSDYDKAGYFLNEALNQLEDKQDSLVLGRIYHDLSWMQYRQGYLEKARNYAEDAELTLGGAGPQKAAERQIVQADCHHLFSLIESAAGAYEAAVSRLEKEIALRQQSGDGQRLAAAYNKLSSILQTRGEIIRAVDLQMKSLDLAESMGNVYRKSITLKNLGEMYFILGDLGLAWKSHTDSLTLSVQAGNHLGFVFNHAGLGRIYRARGAPVSAMTEYRQALEAAKRIKCRDRESGVLADMADLLCDGGLWPEARERLDQARKLDNEREQDPSPWHVLVDARVSAGAGTPEGMQEAVRLLDQLLSGPVIIDDEEFITIPELTMSSLMLRGSIESLQGRTDQAAGYYARARELAEAFCRDFEPAQRGMFLKRREIAAIYQEAGS